MRIVQLAWYYEGPLVCLKPNSFALNRHSSASFFFPKFPRATDLLYHIKADFGSISTALSKHSIASHVLD